MKQEQGSSFGGNLVIFDGSDPDLVFFLTVESGFSPEGRSRTRVNSARIRNPELYRCSQGFIETKAPN